MQNGKTVLHDMPGNFIISPLILEGVREELLDLTIPPLKLPVKYSSF